MSNYPQDKFTAPDISGKWRFWTNIQFITLDGISEIEKLTGIIELNQDNLFYNYVNEELNLIRIGVPPLGIVQVFEIMPIGGERDARLRR